MVWTFPQSSELVLLKHDFILFYEKMDFYNLRNVKGTFSKILHWYLYHQRRWWCL